MAHPFHPMNNYILEKISNLIKESENDVDADRIVKDSISPAKSFPDSNHPLLDQFRDYSDNPQ